MMKFPIRLPLPTPPLPTPTVYNETLVPNFKWIHF